MMEEREVRGFGSRRSLCFRSPLGFPVSCEISVEVSPDGVPVILSSVEIESSPSENKILCQSPVEEVEVLLIYREWRRRSENQYRIRRLDTDTEFLNFQRYGTIKQRTTHQIRKGSGPRRYGPIFD